MLEQFPFLQNEYLGNTAQDYLLTVGFFILSSFLLIVFEKMVFSRAKTLIKNTPWKQDDFLFGQFEKTIIPLLYLGAFYFSVSLLTLKPVVENLVTTFCVAVLTIQTTRMLVAVVVLILDSVWKKKDPVAVRSAAFRSVEILIKVVFWGIALVFLLDNLGFNVSAVVAGLGIGGIAVAFALQAILGDLFNYFVISFDRPFEIGDFIIIGDYLGTIEHIGIKSTRIRSLGGEQIVFSNSDLTASRIRNYKRMEKRRIVFGVGVIYQTTAEQIKKIPGLIRGIIDGIDKTTFDRAHFQKFGNFSLDIEIVYYVLSSDYNVYMDIQQEINQKIFEAFAKEGIEFAYPTQSLFVNKIGAGENKQEGVS